MSIKLIKEKDSEWGRLELTTEEDKFSEEDYINRMHALIEIVQQRNEDYTDPDTTYHVLEILRDMLPTHEQAKQMFITPH